MTQPALLDPAQASARVIALYAGPDHYRGRTADEIFAACRWNAAGPEDLDSLLRRINPAVGLNLRVLPDDGLVYTSDGHVNATERLRVQRWIAAKPALLDHVAALLAAGPPVRIVTSLMEEARATAPEGLPWDGERVRAWMEEDPRFAFAKNFTQALLVDPAEEGRDRPLNLNIKAVTDTQLKALVRETSQSQTDVVVTAIARYWGQTLGPAAQDS